MASSLEGPRARSSHERPDAAAAVAAPRAGERVEVAPRAVLEGLRRPQPGARAERAEVVEARPQRHPDEHQRVGVIGPGVELGGGAIGGGTPNYAAAVSFDYVEVARNPGTLGFRLGFYGGAYGTTFAKQRGFGGFRGALQFNVARPPKGQMLTLGPLVQFTFRDPEPSPAEIGLGLALDWNFVESWSLPSCRNDACRFAGADRGGPLR